MYVPYPWSRCRVVFNQSSNVFTAARALVINSGSPGTIFRLHHSNPVVFVMLFDLKFDVLAEPMHLGRPCYTVSGQ